MKILLISFNQTDEAVHKTVPTDISALGARYLSAFLRQHGFSVKNLFLCKAFGEYETPDELQQIDELLHKEAPDIIGCSLMSNHFLRSVAVTQHIKKHWSLPIIWGGVHPTLEPEASLEFADIVCLGEGEETLAELLSRFENERDYRTVHGTWCKQGDAIFKNPSRVLQQNIDLFPFPDYQLEHHYIIHEGTLRPLTASLYQQYSPASAGQHRVMATRGCPYACSYCCNSAFKKLYKGQYLRRRSVENVIQELETIKQQFPYIKLFKIMDDAFIIGQQAWLEEFAQKYSARVGLPFYCLLSPVSVTKEKIQLLVDAGLKYTQIGLQTGSDRVNREIFQRRMTRRHFLDATHIVSQFYPEVRVVFDVIVDNPYETEADRADTVRTLAQVPKPFNLGLFSLAFYPHTVLYDRAVSDGFIQDHSDEYIKKQFHQVRPTYFNKLIRLTPSLSHQKILWLLEHKSSLLARILVYFIHWGMRQRNRIPKPCKTLVKKWLQ